MVDTVLSVIAKQTENSYSVIRFQSRSGSPSPSSSRAEVTVDVKSPEQTLTSLSIPQGITATGPGGLEASGEILSFVVEFPDTATQLTIDGPERSTSVNPLSESFRYVIQQLPDEAFKRPEQNRRQALLNKIDAYENQLDAENYQGAKKKLRNDIRRSVNRWVKDEYETGALEPTKEDVLEAIENQRNRIESVQAVVEDDSKGDGGGNGNGSGGKGGENGNGNGGKDSGNSNS